MKLLSLILACIGLLFTNLISIEAHKSKNDGYVFTDIKRIPVTSVKDQYRSGTCWSFSVLSLLEAEILRETNKEVDLSEMFIVRNAYSEKAILYVRMHGEMKFSGGGALNDPIDIIKKYGIVPEEIYNGLKIGEQKHYHSEMDKVFKGFVDNIIKNANGKLSPIWHEGFDGLLDTYLGILPEKFNYENKEYTPISFRDEYNLDMDNYVLLSSFLHHNFYDKFIIEVPDNWSWGEAYNLPLDEFKETINNAIENDYTIAWASDISETGFKYKKGFATIPEKEWKDMTDDEKDTVLNKAVPQMEITQEYRQIGFDNYSTQDDHGMHIMGLAKDQLGNKYYIVKNSWGAKNSKYGGYFYVSESYVLYKTLSILLNKNAIPAPIRKKLGI